MSIPFQGCGDRTAVDMGRIYPDKNVNQVCQSGEKLRGRRGRGSRGMMVGEVTWSGAVGGM